MIHELLVTILLATNVFVIYLEYVDWGSQSIAQSKFQRTDSFLGERVSAHAGFFRQSTLFLDSFKNRNRAENPNNPAKEPLPEQIPYGLRWREEGKW